MSFGALIRDLRLARGWSQDHMARVLSDHAAQAALTREDVSRWENGKRTPRDFWLAHLAAVLDVPAKALEKERDKVRRRRFLTAVPALAAGAALPGRDAVAADMAESIAAGDDGPLTVVQTSHRTDLAIRTTVQTDRGALLHLRRWLDTGTHPVLRVNAAGILAKTSSEEAVEDVATALTRDAETRALYVTAVTARVLRLPWEQATVFEPAQCGAGELAALSRELRNARDTGARWCAAYLLGRAIPVHPQVVTVLTEALRSEPSRETLRHIALTATTRGEHLC